MSFSVFLQHSTLTPASENVSLTLSLPASPLHWRPQYGLTPSTNHGDPTFACGRLLVLHADPQGPCVGWQLLSATFSGALHLENWSGLAQRGLAAVLPTWNSLVSDHDDCAGCIKSSHAQELHSSASICTFGANSSGDQAEVRLPLKPHPCLVFLLASPAAFTPLQVTPESSPFTNYLHENSCLRLYFWAIRAHTYIHIWRFIFKKNSPNIGS